MAIFNSKLLVYWRVTTTITTLVILLCINAQKTPS